MTKAAFDSSKTAFAAVGVKNVRHAASCALLADLAGVIAATALTRRFFGPGLDY
jgi:spore maturation protein SpmB